VAEALVVRQHYSAGVMHFYGSRLHSKHALKGMISTYGRPGSSHM